MSTPLQIMNAFEQQFVCAKCRRTRARVSDFRQAAFSFGFDPSHLISVTCRYCGYTENFNVQILQNHADIYVLLDDIYGARATTKLVPPAEE